MERLHPPVICKLWNMTFLIFNEHNAMNCLVLAFEFITKVLAPEFAATWPGFCLKNGNNGVIHIFCLLYMFFFFKKIGSSFSLWKVGRKTERNYEKVRKIKNRIQDRIKNWSYARKNWTEWTNHFLRHERKSSWGISRCKATTKKHKNMEQHDY